MKTTTIRAVERDDIGPIKRLAIDNQMFGPAEVDFFDDTITRYPTVFDEISTIAGSVGSIDEGTFESSTAGCSSTLTSHRFRDP